MIPRLHVLTDDRILARGDFVEAARAVLRAGARRIAFHLRGPRSSGRRLWELGTRLHPDARANGVPLLLNDRLDLALALGAEGVQLALRSLPLPHARRILPEGALIGCSAHGPSEAAAWSGEAGERPDFLLVGALFPTPSHPGAAPAGPGLIGAVRAAVPRVPLIGIGGLTPGRAREVRGMGAHGAAVIRAVWEAPDPDRAVGRLLEETDPASSPAPGGRDG